MALWSTQDICINAKAAHCFQKAAIQGLPRMLPAVCKVLQRNELVHRGQLRPDCRLADCCPSVYCKIILLLCARSGRAMYSRIIGSVTAMGL